MKKLIIGGAILAGLIIVVFVSRLSHSKGTEVEVTDAKPLAIRSSILASGQLAYREQVQLRPEVIGKVTEVLVEEGDHVKKDQVVVRLDPESIKAEVDQQEANAKQQEIAIQRQKLTIQNLENQWHRKQKLHARGLLDDDTFDQATNELEIAKLNLQSQKQALSQAKAQLAEARERLSKTEIEAPMAGVVTGVFVKAGETVVASTSSFAGSSLVSIADPDTMRAEINVDEADIANVREGEDAKIYTSGFPDTAVEGHVDTIATTARQAANRQGLSFLVKLAIKKPAPVDLKPGMSCRAEIFTSDAGKHLAVPIQAVLYEEATSDNPDANQAYVLVDRDGTVKRVNVKTGVSDDRHIAITDGLKDGDTVITGPVATLRTLKDGAQVSIKHKTGAKE